MGKNMQARTGLGSSLGLLGRNETLGLGFRV